MPSIYRDTNCCDGRFQIDDNEFFDEKRCCFISTHLKKAPRVKKVIKAICLTRYASRQTRGTNHVIEGISKWDIFLQLTELGKCFILVTSTEIRRRSLTILPIKFIIECVEGVEKCFANMVYIRKSSDVMSWTHSRRQIPALKMFSTILSFWDTRLHKRSMRFDWNRLMRRKTKWRTFDITEKMHSKSSQ